VRLGSHRNPGDPSEGGKRNFSTLIYPDGRVAIQITADGRQWWLVKPTRRPVEDVVAEVLRRVA
jgi:hypothetical protein